MVKWALQVLADAMKAQGMDVTAEQAAQMKTQVSHPWHRPECNC